MNMHVDKAGQGETAGKSGRGFGRRIRESGNRAVGEFNRRAARRSSIGLMMVMSVS
jgi:hypothetical protein